MTHWLPTTWPPMKPFREHSISPMVQILLLYLHGIMVTDNSTNNPVSWAWDFGDGNTDTVQSPTYVYGVSGTYNACLIATNMCGLADTMCQTVVVCIPTTADFQSTNSSYNVVDFTDMSVLATS